jgi:hypothetical protein
MVYTLTNAEKADIIDQHLKGLEYSKFNLEITLVEESSVPEPKESIVNDIQSQLDDVNLKIVSVLAELAKVS